MQNLIDQLKVARERAEEAKTLRRRMLDDFQTSPEYVAALEQSKAAEQAQADADAALRQATLAAYASDGNKKPHPKVEVVIYRAVNSYDTRVAKEWCFGNLRPALKLDERRFEDAVINGDVPDEIATAADQPRVRIAASL